MKQEMLKMRKSVLCLFAALLLSLCLAVTAYGATATYRHEGSSRATVYPAMGGNMNYGTNSGMGSSFANYYHQTAYHGSQTSSITNGTTSGMQYKSAGVWSNATLWGSFNSSTVFYSIASA